MGNVTIDSLALFRPIDGDYRGVFTFVVALVAGLLLHSLILSLSLSQPEQLGGANDWRVVATVRFVETGTEPEQVTAEAVPPQPVERLVSKKTQSIQTEPNKRSVPEKPEREPVSQPVITSPIAVAKTAPPESPVSGVESTPAQTNESPTESPAEQSEPAQQAPAKSPPQSQNIPPTQLLAAALVTQPAGSPLVEYRSRIIELINANKKYPRAARRRGIEGQVAIHFVVDEHGQVIGLQCEGAADILSRSACDTILKTTPFPAPLQPRIEVAFVMDYVLR